MVRLRSSTLGIPRSPVAAIALIAVVATSCGQLESLSTEQALDRLNVATTKVYDAQGNVIANLHGEINRDIVPLARIPRHVRDAVVAIEDERFWTHQGIDLRSIARAAAQNAGTNGDGRIQGGSTISQQLAKNLYFPDPARTLTRKLAEARVTLQLERQYTKDEVLEMYLNTIYFGRGVYGIETAANSYFGKGAAELTLAEGAFLAGLIHEPARYEWTTTDNPGRRRERLAAARGRRNTVLRRMAALGFIDSDRAEDPRLAPLRVRSAGERRWEHPYFVDYVLRQLGVLRNSRSDRLDPRFHFLGDSFEERSARVYRGGLRIYTTLDPRAQDSAEQAALTVLPAELDRLSMALVAIEPSTGYVRALIGGRDYYPSCPSSGELPQMCRIAKVNLALGNYGGGSGRQPGSAFKPFVLATALQRGITLAQTFPSDPFTYSYPGGVWRVSNYDGAGGGQLDLVSATARSVNAVFARLEIDGVGDGDGQAGAERVAGLARRLGIGFPTREELRAACRDDYARTDPCLPADDTPAIALGAKEVSPFDMATAFATFANDGVRVEPTAIVRVTDGQGRVVYQAEPDRRRVLASAVARSVTSVLGRVIQSGTGTRAAIDRPAAAKTGTSQAWRDAWLAGYVPQLAAVVWVGNPIPPPGEGAESMTPANGYPYRIVGGTLPASIWRAFMSEALEGVPVRRFAPPPAVVFRPPLQAPEPELLEEEPEEDIPSGPGIVPSVIGLLYGRARNNLERAGYEVATKSECSPSRRTRLHRVWAQDPGGGSEASRGDTVTIWYQPGGCD